MDKIKDLRKKLNKEINEIKPDMEKILKLSQELDLYIVEYYKNMGIIVEDNNHKKNDN